MRHVPARLAWLRNREALAAVVLPALIAWKWWHRGGEAAWGVRVAALVLLVHILVQGTLYWHIKLRCVERGKALPRWFHPLFSAFRLSNLAGIAAIALILLGFGRASLSGSDLAWCTYLLAGAVLEQVNYYHYQLMLDTRAAFGYVWRNGRLRKAALGVDLARARPGAGRLPAG